MPLQASMPAPFGVSDTNSRGRRHPEAPPEHRSEFQRDRDRIIHCAAFRRLEYKTQVFVNHEGDMFRTRLTHSLEVAQIARTVARALRVNEDLTEAIALAHDLGHTPFGHAGQDALNACMAEHGGFEHNLQSLRVVDELETRYARFPGLNLSFETREGILKRCSRKRAAALGELGRRFLLGHQPTLEAQIADIADEIAYNNHDLDDGLRSGLLTLAQIEDLSLLAPHVHQLRREWPALQAGALRGELTRRVINEQVSKLIDHSLVRIRRMDPKSPDAVREAPAALISFDAELQARHLELKRFLYANLYQHEHVTRMSEQARRVVRELYHALLDDAGLMPSQPRGAAPSRPDGGRGEHNRYRTVADYVAGMTDRFALAEYRRIFGERNLPVEIMRD